MSKIDEMIATFEAEYDTPVPCRAGLRAVLEKHVKPMVAEAYVQGVLGAPPEGYVPGTANGVESDGKDYAERVISELADQPNRNDRAV